MRYWVYINDKVEGPYEEDKLVTVPGFSPDTLICSEEVQAGGEQEWVKASAVFAFDPVPTDLPQQTAAKTAEMPVLQTAQPTGTDVTSLLLEKLEQLSQKVESLQTKVDQVIAGNAQAEAQQVFKEDYAYTEAIPNTITLTQADMTQEPSATEEGVITNTESLVSQAETLVAQAQTVEPPIQTNITAEDTKEGGDEEVVLRSALDSLYQGELQESEEEKETTFQDLLTPKQAEDLQNTLNQTAAAAPVKEETPAPAEQEKDALLNELTAQPHKDNIIDQVIEEKKAEAAKENVQKVVTQTAAQEAAEAPASELPSLNTPAEQPTQEAVPAQQEQKQSLDLESGDQASLTINQTVEETPATNEELPEARMTQKVAEELQYNNPNGLPSVNDASKQKVKEAQEQQKAEETMQELVPGAKMERPDNAPLITEADLREAFTERASLDEMNLGQEFNTQEPTAETAQPAEEQPTQEAAQPTEEQPVAETVTVEAQSVAVEAPAMADQPIPEAFQQAQEPLPVAEGNYDNANDLTEIELKEGSTYLISDFVPPAQANGNELPKELLEKHTAAEPANKTENTTSDIFEEVVPQVQTAQEQKASDEIKQVTDVTLSKVILENTIKTKRGAALDIKTVPMVPDPAQSSRLDLSDADLEDFNAQHDVKSADLKPAEKSTKMILGGLASLLILAVIYLMLAFMDIIPSQYNLLKDANSAAQQQQAEQLNEMLDQNDTYQPSAQQPEQAADPKTAVITEVQNIVLANGQTLKELVEAHHPSLVNMIEWDAITAVEPDNYSVLIKVPPENPQSFRISYRFNYNTVTQELTPTISDAKNLLDSVNGTN